MASKPAAVRVTKPPVTVAFALLLRYFREAARWSAAVTGVCLFLATLAVGVEVVTLIVWRRASVVARSPLVADREPLQHVAIRARSAIMTGAAVVVVVAILAALARVVLLAAAPVVCRTWPLAPTASVIT